MSNLAVLRPVEMIFVNPERVMQLARDCGVARAEFIAHAALEEIAERLTAAEAAWSAGEFGRLAKVARSLIGVSDQIGMETLGDTARNVAQDALRADDIALAAIVARMIRVGEGSLAAIGELGHLRI